jgi:Fe2+ transport system protein FeoA
MWLLNATRDEIVKVIDFEGGARLQSKLAQYGLYPGDLARVIRVGAIGGPVLIEVSGREIALGRGIAARIRVERT